MNYGWRTILGDYQDLSEGDKLLLIEQLWKLDPFKMEFAKMGESERKFHDSNAKRGE